MKLQQKLAESLNTFYVGKLIHIIFSKTVQWKQNLDKRHACYCNQVKGFSAKIGIGRSKKQRSGSTFVDVYFEISIKSLP